MKVQVLTTTSNDSQRNRRIDHLFPIIAIWVLAITLVVNNRNGLIIQCTEVNNPNVILAQSGPINIASGQNPFSIQTVEGTTIVPSGQSISVFFAPAETGSFPVTTITSAVLTTSFPTVTVVVSSALVNISTERVLTTTITEFSNLVNFTSTGSILVPISTESGNVPSPLPLPPLVQFSPPVVEQAPLVTVFPIASFKKWKRVADGSSVSLGAVTISGTRITSTQRTTSIVSPGTTISASSIKPPTTTVVPPTTTVIPPPITVTVSPSVVTVPPTIITVTPANTNRTFHSSPAPPVVPSRTTITTTWKGNKTSPIPVVPETQCAICTSGLINAGNKVMGEMFGWAAIWIGIIAAIVVRY